MGTVGAMGMVLEVGKEVMVGEEVEVVGKEVMVGKEVVVEGRAVANIHMKTSSLKTPRVSHYICFTEPPEFWPTLYNSRSRGCISTVII